MVKKALTVTLLLALGSGIAYEQSALNKPQVVMDSLRRLSVERTKVELDLGNTQFFLSGVHALVK